MSGARRNAVCLTGVAVLAALVLHRAGAGTLATPDRWTLDAWRAVVLEHGPAEAALVVVRLAALAACAWLAVLGLATALLARCEHRLVRRWLRAATPRLLRPALGAVGALTLAAPAAHAAEPGSPPPVMVLVTTTTTAPVAGPPAASATAAPAAGNAPPTMRRLPDRSAADTRVVAPGAPAGAPGTAVSTPAAPAAPTNARPSATAPVPEAGRWTVARGDHFWHIAEATVERHLGRAPRLAEVDAYWRRLVAANRDRLVDRDNPDLLFAGQELVLPPPA
jgi:hypothetical protein